MKVDCLIPVSSYSGIDAGGRLLLIIRYNDVVARLLTGHFPVEDLAKRDYPFIEEPSNTRSRVTSAISRDGAIARHTLKTCTWDGLV